MLYEFKCAKCDKTVEVSRPVVDRDDHPTAEEFPELCQVADKPHQWARQLIKKMNFNLKGSGWYGSGGY